MLVKPTALIYSSHNRCEYLHRHWIVQRALENPYNKTILYLPFSMGRYDQQEFSWGTFSWYFDRFRAWGLEPYTFFWTEGLSKADADVFFEMLDGSEVVILGGGSSGLGTERYNAMGGLFYGDWELFGRMLHKRQAEGKLTAGFSAGAIQLGDHSAHDPGERCYGLIHNVTTVLHLDWGQDGDLYAVARSAPNHLVFGLPNDSGIASNQGHLGSGNKWQLLQFIIDNSWDIPEDGFHLKTRQGLRIEHVYHDGRRWTLNGGDVMLRIFSPDYSYRGTWIASPGSGAIYDYWTQSPSHWPSLEAILASH
jgi:hypothetical protein